jgi:hypothetical protein
VASLVEGVDGPQERVAVVDGQQPLNLFLGWRRAGLTDAGGHPIGCIVAGYYVDGFVLAGMPNDDREMAVRPVACEDRAGWWRR